MTEPTDIKRERELAAKHDPHITADTPDDDDGVDGFDSERERFAGETPAVAEATEGV